MQKSRKNNSMKSILNAVSGITLIALVVTIVVLLILASVSITVVFGDNGILELAKEAGEKTNEAVKNDISSIGELEDILHETQTGIVVEKVTDTNPGKLEESGESTYTINSIEDLVVFAHNVTSGTETYERKTVKLGLSLDFASTKSYVDANRTDYGKYGYDGELKKLLNESGFIPIGIKEWNADNTDGANNKSFNGTFDGSGNTIYNLILREEASIPSGVANGTGMFIVNCGVIKNLNIENADIYAKMMGEGWSSVGILAASMIEGKINSCYVSGKIVSTFNRCDVGGLVGKTGNGQLLDSYCNVNIEVVAQGYGNEGLIAGSCNTDGIIKNVYAKGYLYKEGIRNNNLALGVSASQGTILNSYTLGKIKNATKRLERKYISLIWVC